MQYCQHLIKRRNFFLFLLLITAIFVIKLIYLQSFQNQISLTNEAERTSLGISLLISNELKKLLRSDIPVVEDIGKILSDGWLEKESIFCQNMLNQTIQTNEIQPCQLSCLRRDLPNTRRNLIVIPYRDREAHLLQLIPHLRTLLKEQQMCYFILIIEQLGTEPFNKGVLMNAGFIEAYNRFPFHCVIFHDVDLVPLSTKIPYTCSIFPRHISMAVDKFENRLPYLELIGGVLSIPFKIFLRVNGFSNLFWGWGGEDDDMYERLMINGIPISRPDPNLAQFTMLKHAASPAFSVILRSQILSFTQAKYRLDGINSLNYTVIDSKQYSEKEFSKQFKSKHHKSNQSIDLMNYILHLQVNVGIPPTWLQLNSSNY